MPVSWIFSAQNHGITAGVRCSGIKTAMPDSHRGSLGWISLKTMNINVESALEDKGSIFYTYQKLISLRHEMDHFTYGSVVPHLMKDYALFAYERVYNGETITVIANFRDETI